MPVPAPRDPDVTRDILTGWLGDPARLPGARITDLQTPEFTGFSSEILMVDVEHGGGTEALAVRVAPLNYQVFPETRFAEQYRLMRILDADTDIPVPPVLWYEPDPGHLGAPFLVMRRIDGRVPTDVPPYHTGGWVTEIEPGRAGGHVVVRPGHRGPAAPARRDRAASRLPRPAAVGQAGARPAARLLRALHELGLPGPETHRYQGSGLAEGAPARRAERPGAALGGRQDRQHDLRAGRDAARGPGLGDRDVRPGRGGPGLVPVPGPAPQRGPRGAAAGGLPAAAARRSRATRTCSAGRCSTWATTRCCPASSSP